MRKLIALFIIASVCGWAQQAKAVTTDERWEYCSAKAAWAGDPGNGMLEGRVHVCYATEQGCRVETITISEQVPAGMKPQYLDSQGMQVLERTIGKALAQLGKDGWEMASVVEPSPQHSAPQRRVFYFKRRAR